MGMLDSQLVFCEGQAVTAVGDTPSTNVITFGNSSLGDNGQSGEHIWVQALCSSLATSGGSATIQPVLSHSANNSTWTAAVSGPVLPVTGGALPAGTIMWQVQPPPGMLQYWRIDWVVAVAALTGGTFDAFITESIERNVAQPSGFTVS